MTKLLVSVRSPAEALVAFAGGADLIDVKEPLHGSLGRASAACLREVAEILAGRVPLSAALGELSEATTPVASEALASYRFAKCGLSGASSNWRQRWRDFAVNLPRDTSPVAVIYADWKTCHAPAPMEVISLASQAGAAGVLVDTFDKSHGGLLDLISLEHLAALGHEIKRHKLFTVYAGSLTLTTAAQVQLLAPDYIAVRGAVCRYARDGTIDESLVRAFAMQLAGRSTEN